jgi:hypothetical protein
MSKLLFSLAILCLLVTKAPAAKANRPAADLISALASTDAKQVDKAREELIALGGEVVNSLENHQTNDKRVASSIKYVLNRICNYCIRIDPKRGKDIKSPGGNGIQVMLSIKNNTAHAVKLCWVDRTGNRVPYKDIKPGSEIKQRSFEYHCWIILDKNSQPLGIYRSTYQDGRILVEQRFF